MTEERHTLSEAASLLGITPDALRQRIRRGRHHTEKEAGRVYVYLDTDRTETERPTEQGADVLIPELRARIESLERQLDHEREANRENRRLLAAALERMPPQVEAPEESQQAETTTEQDNVWTPRKQAMLGAGALALSSLISVSVLGFFLTSVSTGEGSLSAIISSVWTAFSTPPWSLSGDQLVTIISAIITVVGTIAATVIGIRLRRGRNE